MWERLQRIQKAGAALGTRLSFLAPTLTRMVVGYGFFLTGRGKLNHLDTFAGLLQDLGIPFPEIQANFVAHLEYYGGIAILLGVLTRFVAFFLSSTMVVALLTADKMAFLQSWNPGGETVPIEVASFVYLVMLTWLVFHGAGCLSLDGLFGWLWARRKSAALPIAPALSLQGAA